MNNISDKAIVSPDAKLGDNISIGPFSIIEDDVVIQNDVTVKTSVFISSGTRIQAGCKIYHSAVLGADPQDLKFTGEHTTLEIGSNTVIREFTTISRGTGASHKTVIGNNCFFMNYVHIPHDSVIGNNVILANATNLGGHVKVEDWVIIGGLTGVHQFVKIGTHSLIAFSSRVTQDVPPYILAGGNPIHFKGLNLVGLKRRGFSEEQIRHIKQTYNFIYGAKYNISDALKAVKDSIPLTDEVKKIISFIETSERGIIRK